MLELRLAALGALRIKDPAAKVDATRSLADSAHAIDPAIEFSAPADIPGRPERPVLVRPGEVAQRSVATPEGRAALLHALAHIEFNAINLALDIVWRFARMPEEFYREWIEVAVDEAGHFLLLRERLAELGLGYGDFPAHDGLWEMAERTGGDLIARLALVPRTLEARGLDASPAVRAKFASVGDAGSAQVVDRILRDEIGHVAAGNRWFRYACSRAGLDPISAHEAAILAYRAPRLRGPFNVAARRAAGFDAEEIQALSNGSHAGPP